jgi:hypothetical protein
MYSSVSLANSMVLIFQVANNVGGLLVGMIGGAHHGSAGDAGKAHGLTRDAQVF